MGKLSLKKYSLRCVLGVEVFYIVCLTYGTFLSGKAQELHHSLFGLIPGFAWGSIVGIIWGAILLAIFAWIFGAYMVWMHNSSIER